MWYKKGVGLHSYKMKEHGGSYLKVGGRFLERRVEGIGFGELG